MCSFEVRGGEGGLPLCEPLGYPPPKVTSRLRLNHYTWDGIELGGEHFYEGTVVTGSVDDVEVAFEGEELNAWFAIHTDSSAAGPLRLPQIFSEGEELDMTFMFTDNATLVAELRRRDGSLRAFIHTGRFEPERVTELELPISWNLKPWCHHDGSTNASESLKVQTHLEKVDVELSAYEEQQFDIEGDSFMLTVHYAAILGDCPSETCSILNRAAGPHLDAQLIALD